jgi:RBB1NT (NUC162) domain/ARID/BRIGHT DNA binding domain
VHTVVKNIKVKIAYKKGGNGSVSDDLILGEIRVGNVVEIKDPDKKENVEATITKIQDCSQYTVVFDDGDIATLRRSALCRQSGKHFNACDTLDQLPLTHPEHRGGGKRSKAQDEYESDDEEYAIGKVVCVENTDTKKKNAKESYFPALIVAPKAQESVKINVKTDYLVRSFKDGRYYTVPKKEVTELTNETASKSDNAAVTAAREFLDKNVLPTHWDREVLIDSASLSEQELSDTSDDDEPNEIKDRFIAQLLEFMEKRNSPLNKGPSITNRDVDLYRLYYSVEKLGGYANVTKIRNWKAIAKRLGFTPTDAIVKLVKHSYRKFLLAFEEAVSKGIEDLPPRANREKARSSSTRSGSVASPKVIENVRLKLEC